MEVDGENAFEVEKRGSHIVFMCGARRKAAL